MKGLARKALSRLATVVRMFRKRPGGPYSAEADNHRQSGWPFGH